MTIFNARGHYSVENEVRFCGERYMLCMDQDLNVTASDLYLECDEVAEGRFDPELGIVFNSGPDFDWSEFEQDLDRMFAALEKEMSQAGLPV